MFMRLLLRYILLSAVSSFLFFSCITNSGTSMHETDTPGAGQEKSPLDWYIQEYIGGEVAQNIMQVFPGSGRNNSSGKNVVTDEEKSLTAFAVRLLPAALFTGRLAKPRKLFVRILETDEFNSVSAGDGTILITRGLLNCAGTEAMKAALLAHEIAHLALGHPLAPVKGDELSVFFEGDYSSIRQRVIQDPGLKAVTDRFILDSLVLVMDTGYGDTAEFEADRQAASILKSSGYPVSGLTALLARLQTKLDPLRPDMAATHPPPQIRLEKLLI